MRRQHDAYYTPHDAVRALRSHFGAVLNPYDFYLEPCVGNGSIIKGFRESDLPSYPKWRSVDIDTTVVANMYADMTTPEAWQKFTSLYGQPDWVISNPPFGGAMSILCHAYQHARRGVCFLLRLSFLEPTYDRGDWLQRHPPTSIIVLPRISFTGDGKTDSVTCAWMIWDKHGVVSPITVVSKGDKQNGQ